MNRILKLDPSQRIAVVEPGVINAQVTMMQGYWYDKVEISVFLCTKTNADPDCKGKAITQEQTRTLEAELKKMPGVEQVFYEDQATAFKNFQDAYKGTNQTLANVLLDLKEPARAEAILAKMVRLDPRNSEYLRQLGRSGGSQ